MKKVRLQGMASVALAAIGAFMLFATGCNTKDPKYEQAVVSVDSSALSVDSTGGVRVVQVASNRSWTVTVPANISWVVTTPDTLTYVNGDGPLTIAIARNQTGASRTAVLTIHASSATAYVTITQAAAGSTPLGAVLYIEDCGPGVASPGPYPLVADYTQWKRGGTLDQSAVTYAAGGGTVSVRASNASSGYPGASGAGCVFFGGTAASLVVSKIAVTGTNLTLKFGVSDGSGTASPYFVPVTPATMQVYGNLDGGTNWTPIPFTNDATSSWVLATAPFNVPAGPTTIYLKFVASATVSSAIRLDDMTLYQGGGSSSVVLGGGGTPPPPPPSAILFENFGTTATASPYPGIATYTGVIKSGTGAANVTYTNPAGTVSVRASTPSTGYTNPDGTAASGVNNVFFGQLVSGEMDVNAIDVTGNTNLVLTFGVYDGSGTVSPYAVPITASSVQVSTSTDNGATWTAQTFTNASTASWVLATSKFSVPAGATKLAIKFVSAATTALRIDDIMLTGDGTVTPPAMAFGTPAASGSLTLNTPASNVSVTIPFTNGDGKANPITATISGVAGLNPINNANITPAILTGNGNITIPITGTPTATGTATVTLHGSTLEGKTVTFTVVNATDVYPIGNIATGDFATVITSSTVTSVSAPLVLSGGVTISRLPTNPTTGFGSTFSSLSIYTANWWADASTITAGVAWQFAVPLTKSLTGKISISYNVFGTATSPAKWAIQYSTNGTTWTDADTYTAANPYIITATATPGQAVIDTFTVPGTVAAGGTLLIKAYPLSVNTVVTTGTPSTGGNSRLQGPITIARTL